MKDRLTIIEVADALGLSRNTVSKVINNKEGVSQKTKTLVNDYLKYGICKNTSSLNSFPSINAGKYIVFSCHYENTEYFANVLSNIEETLKKYDYELIMNIIRDNSVNIPVPNALIEGTACGIISFNIFDKYYWETIINLKVPAVFIDTFYDENPFINRTDIVTMESVTPIKNLIHQFVNKGLKSFGYVGDHIYCYSIYQRWKCIKDTLAELKCDLDPNMCFYDCSYDSEKTPKELEKRIRELKKLPEVFMCGNDSYATIVLHTIKDMGYSIPEDVSIVGFDNSSETLRQQPPITTIDAHPDFIGKTSAKMLLERLEDPDMFHKFVLTQSDIVLRQTTNL